MKLMKNLQKNQLIYKVFLYVVAAMLLLLDLVKGFGGIIIYSALMIPFAIILGELTAGISVYIGDKKGGLLSAALGNVPELTMGIWSIYYGMISMVKAALIGSIVSNMLLVLGVSIFAGGIKYREQHFNKIVARTNFTMVILALATMIITASLNNYSKIITEGALLNLSIGVSLVLIIVYVLGLIFSLHTHSNLFVLTVEENVTAETKLSIIRIFVEIIITGLILYFVSEKLIVNIRLAVDQYSIPQEFLGIFLIPLLGNTGENFSAIICAMKNKMNLSLEIAIGSSIQISMFVTPILIIFSYIMGINMTYIFSNFQIVICVIAILMALLVFQDGKTYWLEGAVLISVYMVIILAYYYMV